MEIIFVYRDLLSAGGDPYDARALCCALHKRGDPLSFVGKAMAFSHALYQRVEESISAESVYAQIVPGHVDDACFEDIGASIKSRRALFKFILNGDVRKRSVVIIYSLNIPYHIPVYLLCRLFRLKFIVFTNGIAGAHKRQVRWGGRKGGALHRILKRLYFKLIEEPMLRGALAVRAYSKFEESELRDSGVRRFVHIPDGIDTKWLLEIPAKGACSGQIQLLFIGRIDPYHKGLDLFMEALARIEAEFPGRFRFCVAGPGPADVIASLEQICRGRFSNYAFIGPVNDAQKADLWQKSHFFVHVSRFEGMSKAPRESLAAGVPVMASYESNFGSLVEEQGLGFACRADTDSAAEMLRQVAQLSDRDYAQLEARSRSALSVFGWPAVAASLQTQIDALIANAAER